MVPLLGQIRRQSILFSDKMAEFHKFAILHILNGDVPTIMNLEGLPTDFFPHMTKSPQKRLPAQSENLICLKKTIYADGKHFSPKTLK